MATSDPDSSLLTDKPENEKRSSGSNGGMKIWRSVAAGCLSSSSRRERLRGPRSVGRSVSLSPTTPSSGEASCGTFRLLHFSSLRNLVLVKLVARCGFPLRQRRSSRNVHDKNDFCVKLFLFVSHRHRLPSPCMGVSGAVGSGSEKIDAEPGSGSQTDPA